MTCRRFLRRHRRDQTSVFFLRHHAEGKVRLYMMRERGRGKRDVNHGIHWIHGNVGESRLTRLARLTRFTRLTRLTGLTGFTRLTRFAWASSVSFSLWRFWWDSPGLSVNLVSLDSPISISGRAGARPSHGGTGGSFRSRRSATLPCAIAMKML